MTSAGIFHAASEDIVLCGYTVPAGAIVLPDFDCLFMDPDIWGDPEVFRPDRFLDKEGNLVKKEEFLPFFIGKRPKYFLRAPGLLSDFIILLSDFNK